MAHFSAFWAFENGLVEPCARHDSNVRPLPPREVLHHSMVAAAGYVVTLKYTQGGRTAAILFVAGKSPRRALSGTPMIVRVR